MRSTIASGVSKSKATDDSDAVVRREDQDIDIRTTFVAGVIAIPFSFYWYSIGSIHSPLWALYSTSLHSFSVPLQAT